MSLLSSSPHINASIIFEQAKSCSIWHDFNDCASGVLGDSYHSFSILDRVVWFAGLYSVSNFWLLGLKLAFHLDPASRSELPWQWRIDVLYQWFNDRYFVTYYLTLYDVARFITFIISQFTMKLHEYIIAYPGLLKFNTNMFIWESIGDKICSFLRNRLCTFCLR